MLRCSRLHFIGGHQNVVGACGHFHGSFADALENLGEIVEHVVDRIRHVSQGVAGYLPALRQVATRHLVDDTQQFGDATLQRVIRVLVARCLGHLGNRAIQVFCDVAQLIVRSDFCACPGIACRQPFGEFGEGLYRSQQRTEAPCQDDRCQQRQHNGQQHRSSGRRAEVKQGRFTGFFTGGECQS